MSHVKLTIAQVKAARAQLLSELGEEDFEAAHSTEDDLMKEFVEAMQHVLDYTPNEIKEIAEIIAGVNRMEFTRWYA